MNRETKTQEPSTLNWAPNLPARSGIRLPAGMVRGPELRIEFSERCFGSVIPHEKATQFQGTIFKLARVTRL